MISRKSLHRIIFSLLTTTIASSFAGFMVGFNNLNKSISSHNLNANSNSVVSSSSNTRASGTWNDESLIAKNDYLSNVNMPNGYLTISETDKTINLITWFGTQSWSYNVANSPFLAQGITGYNAANSTLVIHVYYLANYDRVLVYGTVNSTTTYVFQLNSDGTEYYVNNDDSNKVRNSSLISGRDTGVIGSAYSINLLNDNSAIILPKNFDKNVSTISATKFTFNSFTATPINYDLTGWSTSTDRVPSTAYSTWTFGSIIGVSESSDGSTSYLITKASSANGSTGQTLVHLVYFKFTNNVYETMISKTISHLTTSTVDLEKAYFKMLTTVRDSVPYSYVALVNNISDPNSVKLGAYSGATSSPLDDNNTTLFEFAPNSGTISNFFVMKKAAASIMDIFINPYNSRPYAVIKNYNANNFYFSDLLNNKANAANGPDNYLLSVKKWSNFPSVTSSSDNSRIDLIWRPIFESGVTTPRTVNGIVSVLRYADDATTTVSSSITYRFGVTDFTTASQTTTFIVFNASVINSYQNLTSQYYYLLPQDITNDIFEKFIYLTNADGSGTSANRPFNSNITIPNNSLTINNTNGTLSGTINLNITKWWLTSAAGTGTSNIYTIPVSVNLTGLATNSSLNFQIVNSKDINTTKYNKILEFQRTKYPNEITAQEILDNFIVFGNSLRLTTANVLMINANSNSGNTTPQSDQYITVTANNDDGTLAISWNLTSIISPSITVKSGSYTFNNFKHLNAWNQITLNDRVWNTLKTSKSPFQINVEDIISALNLSSGYVNDPSYWTWSPTYSESNNKVNYVKQSVDGNFTGTITYNRDKAGVPSTVPESYTKFEITSTHGTGFLTIDKLLGSHFETTLYYNENAASKLASSYDLSKVESDFANILENSLVFYNGWTTSSSVNYQITSTNNSQIVFSLSYKDNIETNLKKADGTNLVLDSEWINGIQSSNNNVLNLASSYSFAYNLTSVEYNYNLTTVDNKIDIKSVLNSSTTSSIDYTGMKASKFISSFYNGQTNSYDNFLKAFDLVKLPTNTSAINYYYISDVQLTSDDVNGTVTIYYTFTFPNAGDVEGSSSTSSIILSGFLTNQSFSNNWLIICSAIVGIILLMLASGSTSIFVYKKRMNKKRINYGLGSKDYELNLEKVQRNFSKSDIHKHRVRNTINSYHYGNQNSRANRDLKTYSKKLEEVKKMKK
ncbi:hypothetical protein [Malacoplasma penetrans]|uniref:Uncharacterized protein n=1 Tax=Malacoplasma penetrans (strain HF-2) TaxID=272633 RepID=Q8EUX5_MALP2|nr:hypothetical protein [Malacoplasma penetrans]BAC44586.1 hypothetical protein [Malacoplasma penetrans HF-2]